MGRAEAHVAFPFSGAVWNIAHMLANARTTALYNQNNLSSPSDYPGERIFVYFVGIQCRLSPHITRHICSFPLISLQNRDIRQIFAKFLAYLKKLLYHCTAKAVRTLKVCAYVRTKDKFLRKTKKNLHISKKCSTFAAAKVQLLCNELSADSSVATPQRSYIILTSQSSMQ